MPRCTGRRNYWGKNSGLCALRIAFSFSCLFFIEGLTKNVRFLYSFNIPDLSYFFLNLLRALSIDSLSPMEIPTKFYSPRFNFY